MNYLKWLGKKLEGFLLFCLAGIFSISEMLNRIYFIGEMLNIVFLSLVGVMFAVVHILWMPALVSLCVFGLLKLTGVV